MSSAACHELEPKSDGTNTAQDKANITCKWCVADDASPAN